jgi:hypothetical protein
VDIGNSRLKLSILDFVHIYKESDATKSLQKFTKFVGMFRETQLTHKKLIRGEQTK